ncbi:hypothetical protein NECID01_1658 [Nematocida sp. AWRm77]|nr:hypothetical protein NECID01_1658 [Nematocida sp. AWRm77]
MSYTARDTKEEECKCSEAIRAAMDKMQHHITEMQMKTEKTIKEFEEKERKRTEKLGEIVVEHMKKTLAGVCESMLQKELRGPILQKLEKTLGTRIEQKLTELTNSHTASIAGIAENKALHNTLTKALKSGIVEPIVPIFENGINELRLQVLEQVEQIVLVAKGEAQALDTEDNSMDSEDGTLGQIADSLKSLVCSENIAYEDHPHETIIHLLETNIRECFVYVVNYNNPDVLLFLLDHLPVDAEVDIPSSVLVSFINQLVSIITSIDKKHTANRLKHILLLNNALSQVQINNLDVEEKDMLNSSLSFLRLDSEFGQAPEEKETFTIMERIHFL